MLQAYAVSHGKATAYLPVIELLKSYFDMKSEDDERKRREKVGGKVLMLDRSLEDTLPYLFALLGIEEQPSLLAQADRALSHLAGTAMDAGLSRAGRSGE